MSKPSASSSAVPRRRVVFRLLLILVIVIIVGAASWGFVWEFVMHGQGATTYWVSTPAYREMRKMTRNNYSHFLRDLVWRSVLRDWPHRPVRLERWMMDREPGFFRRVTRETNVTFDVVPNPNTELFEWDACLRVCGAFFEDKCTSPVNLGDAFRKKRKRKRKRTIPSPSSEEEREEEEKSAGGQTETETTRVVAWLTRGESNTRRAIADERRVFDEAARRATTTTTTTTGRSSSSGGGGGGGRGGGTKKVEMRLVETARIPGVKTSPLTAQGEVFSNVDVLVSLHGAGLTNMLFMPRGGRVVEIMPGQYDKPTYRELARNLGLEYVRVYTSRAKPSLPTRIAYALDSPGDRARKLRRDAIVELTDQEIDNVVDAILRLTPR